MCIRDRSESFATRDEQEVAGYADAMEMIFDGHEAITITENHIRPVSYTHLDVYKRQGVHRLAVPW